MIYIRNLFQQDLRDGKQIAFPSEPSNIFFRYNFSLPDPHRRISFKYIEKDTTSPLWNFNNRNIQTRLYDAGSEARIDGELKQFLRDELKAKVDDIVVFKALSETAYEFEFIPQTSTLYIHYKTILRNKNHEIVILPIDIRELAVNLNDFDKYWTYIATIKTKPFILLAGISGTGKSRLVREFAYMSCPPLGKLQVDQTTPGNYCMIEVKPNWHDSTELLGYFSGIQQKYIVTPFVKFLVKAMRYPEVPFFACLDEMNLAPVEQYFAEYLSVLETRKKAEDSIISGGLINKDIFVNYEAEIFSDLGLIKEESLATEELDQITKIENDLQKYGLRIPQNLIVIGTVNMDDTTHQFSRKVIDRAMTIEMNHIDFEGMFNNLDTLQYVDKPMPKELLIADCTTASQALELIPDDAVELKEKTIATMNHLDIILKNTPFRIAYRVQNEMILYYRNMRYLNPEVEFNILFGNTVDAILNMKVLPRIEGDEDLVEKPLKDLELWCKEKGYPSSLAKINEMLTRLARTHYTSYWP